jgi:hypothetical protein
VDPVFTFPASHNILSERFKGFWASLVAAKLARLLRQAEVPAGSERASIAPRDR